MCAKCIVHTKCIVFSALAPQPRQEYVLTAATSPRHARQLAGTSGQSGARAGGSRRRRRRHRWIYHGRSCQPRIAAKGKGMARIANEHANRSGWTYIQNREAYLTAPPKTITHHKPSLGCGGCNLLVAFACAAILMNRCWQKLVQNTRSNAKKQPPPWLPISRRHAAQTFGPSSMTWP